LIKRLGRARPRDRRRLLAGVLMAWYPKVDAAVSPLMKSLYPMPKSPLVPVMILWFASGAGSKIASIFMAACCPSLLSSYNGARGCEQTLIGRRWAWALAPPHAVGVVFPAALPEILAGVRNALAISFILLVTFGSFWSGSAASATSSPSSAMAASMMRCSRRCSPSRRSASLADRAYLVFMRQDACNGGSEREIQRVVADGPASGLGRRAARRLGVTARLHIFSDFLLPSLIDGPAAPLSRHGLGRSCPRHHADPHPHRHRLCRRARRRRGAGRRHRRCR